MNAGPVCLGRAVPLYVHPVLAASAWRSLPAADLGAGFVVVNTADGPGTAPEQAYLDVLPGIVRAGTPLVGYVDAAYGRRDHALLVEDVRRWRDWYGVTGAFLDRVPSHPEGASAIRLVDAVRAAGAGRVVANPGVVPDPAWCAAADVVVVFEGTWTDHRALVPPDGLRDVPPERVCHLVHTVPARVAPSEVAARAAAAGAGIAGVSHATMPNPWTGLPTE